MKVNKPFNLKEYCNIDIEDNKITFNAFGFPSITSKEFIMIKNKIINYKTTKNKIITNFYTILN